LEKLGAAFEQFFWFPGNHDLFYKDKRDIHSSAFGRHIPGVTVVDGITTIDDVTLVPWLVEDEWKTMKSIKSRYVFGHFELPHFFMNAMVQMPDHGELALNDLTGPEFVFSGHFHKRQNNRNIHYIGTIQRFYKHGCGRSYDKQGHLEYIGEFKNVRPKTGKCCAQFIVSRDAIRKHPREFYEKYYTWLIEKTSGEGNGSVDDMYSGFWTGRYAEYSWRFIFGN
jgi:hypothetical protein